MTKWPRRLWPFPNPISIVPQGDKLTRMEAETARIEAHVALMLAFPNGRHDDQVDSVSQFLRWAWTRTRRTSIPVPPELFVHG